MHLLLAGREWLMLVLPSNGIVQSITEEYDLDAYWDGTTLHVSQDRQRMRLWSRIRLLMLASSFLGTLPSLHSGCGMSGRRH